MRPRSGLRSMATQSEDPCPGLNAANRDGLPDSTGEGDRHRCIDPDCCRPAASRGQAGARITSTLPPELAAFKPPRELIWLGSSERGDSQLMTTSAVYHTDLAPDAARETAAGALTAAGWNLQSRDPLENSAIFVSPMPGRGEAFCRDGKQLMVSGLLDA